MAGGEQGLAVDQYPFARQAGGRGGGKFDGGSAVAAGLAQPRGSPAEGTLHGEVIARIGRLADEIGRRRREEHLAALDDFLDLVLAAVARCALHDLFHRVGAADGIDDLFLFIRTVAVGAAAFARELLANYNVTVLPGSFLAREAQGSNPGAGRIRMALVAETAECVEAAQRIVQFVRGRST